MKKIILLFCLMVSSLFSSMSFAIEDSEIAEKARNRQFTGGADEEDLKVQQLPTKDQKNKTDANQEANEGF